MRHSIPLSLGRLAALCAVAAAAWGPPSALGEDEREDAEHVAVSCVRSPIVAQPGRAPQRPSPLSVITTVEAPLTETRRRVAQQRLTR